MSTPSLGVLSTLAVQHHAKDEDSIPLEVRSPLESEPSGNLKSESLHEVGRLQNVYLSGRSPSELSRRDSFANHAHQLVSRPSASLVLSSSSTHSQKRTSLTQFLVICWCIYVVGWHDGSNGPLLPRIQQEYQVRFLVVFFRLYGQISTAAFVYRRINGFCRQLFCRGHNRLLKMPI